MENGPQIPKLANFKKNSALEYHTDFYESQSVSKIKSFCGTEEVFILFYFILTPFKIP